MLNSEKTGKEVYTILTLLVVWMYLVGVIKLMFFPSLSVVISNAVTLAGFFIPGAYWFFKSHDRSCLIRSTVVSLVIVLACFLLCGFVYDFSFDGQGYHQNAVVKLASGWNYVHDFSSGAFHERWIDHYPKAGWLVSSSYFQLIGNLEATKAINLILIIASFLMGLSALPLLGLRQKWIVMLMSALMAFDPINLNSFLSFTNDGLVSSGLLICSYLLLMSWNTPNKSNFWLLALVAIFTINIKFNALVYIAVLFSVYLLLSMLHQKEWKSSLRNLSLIFLIGVGFFGYNPYVKHVVSGLHLFHPIMQYEAKEDLGIDYMPSNLRSKNSATRLAHSIFAPTSFSKSFGNELPLKIPFGVSRQELETYAANGVMIGGMGPWFSGALIFGLILLMWSFIRARPINVFQRNLLLIIVALMISTLINPLCWWFRTVPHLYFILPLIIVFAISIQDVYIRKFAKGLLIVLVVNSCLMGGYVIYQPWASIRLKAELKAIKVEQYTTKKDLQISFGQHGDSFQNKLDLHKISYVEKQQVNCALPMKFKLNEVQICKDE